MAPAHALIFTRHPRPWMDLPIRAWEGDDASHVGVQVAGRVIDATLQHGVAPTSLMDWTQRRQVVQWITVTPRSEAHQQRATENLESRLGLPYDVAGILGFPALRDTSDPYAFWCSELAALWWEDMTGITLPGRVGRRGVRLLRWAAYAHEQALLTMTNTASRT